jgi:hypothetical protein
MQTAANVLPRACVWRVLLYALFSLIAAIDICSTVQRICTRFADFMHSQTARIRERAVCETFEEVETEVPNPGVVSTRAQISVRTLRQRQIARNPRHPCVKRAILVCMTSRVHGKRSKRIKWKSQPQLNLVARLSAVSRT